MTTRGQLQFALAWTIGSAMALGFVLGVGVERWLW